MRQGFRGISLRQVVEDDMPFLFRLFTDPDRCHLWLRGRRIYDEAGFHRAWSAWTAESMAANFIVEAAGRPAGLVFDYDRVLEDGHTKVTALLEEGSTGHGGGVIATALLVGWLFDSLPFRKVYMEVFGYNAAVARMLRKLDFAEEGVLKADRFWNGSYWDLHIFALSREKWPGVRARLLRIPEAVEEPAIERPAAGRRAVMADAPNGRTNGSTRERE